MRFSWANVILLGLLTAQLATGYIGMVNAASQRAWVLWWHGFGAYAIVWLLFWKGSIVWHVWKRGRRWTVRRFAFLLLTILLLLVLLSGILWSFDGPIYLGGFSLVSLHIYLAVPLIGLLAWHSFHMRWIWKRPEARDRRAFLRAGLLQAAGVVSWIGVQQGKKLLAVTGAERRFSGSYEVGSWTGRFPITSWIADRPNVVDPTNWRLTVTGSVAKPFELPYEELLLWSQHEKIATLDCTGGFYTTQQWRGVLLQDILDRAQLNRDALSVTVRSVTGYHRRFRLGEAATYLLATHIGAEPLSHGHGAPVRLVAINKRGYAWVKWVTRIEVNSSSVLWQPPLPLQ